MIMIGNRRKSTAVTYHVSQTCTPSPTQRLIAVVILSILSMMFMLLLDDGSNNTDVSYDDNSGIYRQLQNDNGRPSLLRQGDEEDDVTDREEEYVEAEVEDTSEEQRHDSDELSGEQHVDGSSSIIHEMISKAESEEGEEDEEGRDSVEKGDDCSEKKSRPIMHTYFDDLQNFGAGMNSTEHHQLIDVWKKSWQDAGFDTVVLSRKDAEKHPDYERHSQKLIELGVNEYNQACFLRWLAMASLKDDCQDGGWMSDYDTFPLGLTSEEALDIEKMPGFKSYAKHVPNIIHCKCMELFFLLILCLRQPNSFILFFLRFVADAAHWESILEKLIHPPDELQERDPNLSEYEKRMVTDMLMLLEAQKKYGNKALGISVWEHKSTGFLYNLQGNINCARGRHNKVAHLSHTECEVAYRKDLYPDIGGEVNEKTIVHRRHEAAQKLMNDFRSKCIDNKTMQF